MPSCRDRFLAVALACAASALVACSSGGSEGEGGDTTPPRVVAASPPEGAIDVAPTALAITATFDEAVDSSTVHAGTFVLRDALGAPVAGAASAAGATATLTPASPLAWLTTYTATLTTGVRDLAGNALGTPFSWTFTTAAEPDTVAPFVVSHEPAANAVSVTPDAQVTVTFSEPMEPLSTAAAFSLGGPGGAVPASVVVDGASAMLTPAARLSEVTTYTARITTAALDLHGNPLQLEVAWEFTTGDTTPPLVSSVSPTSGASNVDVGIRVELHFSEPMDGATVTSSTFQLRDPDAAAVPGTVQFGGNAAFFVPAAPLAPDTAYTVVASTGMEDLAGNPLAAEHASSFTTTGAGTGSWAPMAAPSPLEPFAARAGPSAVWTGSELIVWGGWYLGSAGQVHVLATGGRYAPSSDAWQAIPSNIPSTPTGRFGHATIWTGSRMIVWGGNTPGGVTDTGGVLDPGGAGSWTATSTAGAPEARANPAAVWTGSEAIVWGGWDPGGFALYHGTGGRYAPATNTWVATSQLGAPTPRVFPAAVWTGSRMIVWGGLDGSGVVGDGAAYDPGADAWEPIAAGGPSPRWKAAAVWTGSRMIVWGGADLAGSLADGAAYDPASDTWSALPTLGAPPPRERPAAVWTGARAIVWGGGGTNPPATQTGGAFDDGAGTWTLTALAGAPSARTEPAAAWTGTEMIIWGGFGGGSVLKDGARFTP